MTPDHAGELDGLTFAFVSMDSGDTKRWLLQAMEERGIPFIDCGVGVEEVDGALTGQVRTTTGLPGKTRHIWEQGAISFAEPLADAAYTRNIQIADLNGRKPKSKR